MKSKILSTPTLSMLLAGSMVFAGSYAMANAYVICGKSVDPDGQKVTGFELELSSESDTFKGPVAGTWHMKIGSQSAEWLAPSKKIIASTSNDSGQVDVTVMMTHGRSVTGPVGSKYILKDLYNDQPTLEKYIVGGVVGLLKVGTFECYSGND